MERAIKNNYVSLLHGLCTTNADKLAAAFYKLSGKAVTKYQAHLAAITSVLQEDEDGLNYLEIANVDVPGVYHLYVMYDFDAEENGFFDALSDQEVRIDFSPGICAILALVNN